MRAHGVDPGQSSALATVEDGRCVGLVQVYGTHWLRRMDEAIRGASAPVYCEIMQPKIRASAHARNHAVAFSLGRKVGIVEALCYQHKRPFLTLTTAAWWAALPTALGPKRADPSHRILECCGMVKGAAAWLEDVPEGRRVDCAEAVLIAYAGSLLHGR